MAQNTSSVTIQGKSDSYDNTLKKIIEMNQKLTQELNNSKKALESTNAVYKQLSTETSKYVESLGKVVGESTQGSKTVEESISKVQKKVIELNGNARKQGLQAIEGNIKSIVGLLRGNGNFANILTSALKTTTSQASTLTSSLSTTSTTLTATGTASAGASAGIAGIGTTALATTTVVTGLIAALGALVAMMYKLGKGGYEYELTIANAENVLGTSFNTAYKWAQKLNNELGIAEDRTLSLISSTAQMGRASGMTTQSSANMGLGVNRWAVDISKSTGVDVETLQSEINQAISTGSNTLLKYGIGMDPNAAKMWLKQKEGVDAFNGSVSKSREEYGRYMLIKEQMELLNYKELGTTNNLATMQLKLKNTWDSVAKHAQVIFIPVLQVVGEALLAIGKATLFVVNGFRELMGMDALSLANNIGPSAESIDAAQDLYAQYKKTGDQLDAIKQQLYGYDEVITQNPYDNTIADLTLEGAGLGDVISIDGEVEGSKQGESYARAFRERVKTILDRMGPIGKAYGVFFNIDNKTWEEMTDIEQWLNKPGKKFLELVKKGEATGWDLLKALVLEGMHEMPIIAEIEALLNGDGAEFIKSMLQTGLLFNPITWPIGLLWKGFDILERFKDENDSWETVMNFLGLNKLTDAAERFKNWIQEGIDNIRNFSISGAVSNLGSWISDKTGFSFNNSSSYSSGGFGKANQIARIEPQSYTLPTSSQSIYKNITENMSGGNITINTPINAGTVVADNYSLEVFSRKIGQNIENQLRQTGKLGYGSR